MSQIKKGSVVEGKTIERLGIGMSTEVNGERLYSLTLLFTDGSMGFMDGVAESRIVV
jgi:hypothetical protein